MKLTICECDKQFKTTFSHFYERVFVGQTIEQKLIVGKSVLGNLQTINFLKQSLVSSLKGLTL